MTRELRKGLRAVFLAVYAPVYITAYALSKVAKLLLGISYIALFDFRMGRDVLRFLFGPGATKEPR